MAKEKKELSKEEKLLQEQEAIRSIEHGFDENPHSDRVYRALAELEGKPVEEYDKTDPHGIGVILDAHLTNTNEEIKENITYKWLLKNKSADALAKLLPALPELKDKDDLTYDWIIKNKSMDETIKLFQILPELKDRDRYSDVFKQYDKLVEAASYSKDVGSQEIYVRGYYDKKKDDAKTAADKRLWNGRKRALTMNDESTKLAFHGIMFGIQYELQQELKKAGAKDEKE